MNNEKHTYYVSLVTGDILREPADSEAHFRVRGTEEEIADLHDLFAQNYKDELKTFARSHIPYKEYHKQSENNKYDDSLAKIYAGIYKLGDEEARAHIEEMGILANDHQPLRKDIEALKD